MVTTRVVGLNAITVRPPKCVAKLADALLRLFIGSVQFRNLAADVGFEWQSHLTPRFTARSTLACNLSWYSSVFRDVDSCIWEIRPAVMPRDLCGFLLRSICIGCGFRTFSAKLVSSLSSPVVLLRMSQLLGLYWPSSLSACRWTASYIKLASKSESVIVEMLWPCAADIIAHDLPVLIRLLE